jgi:uncharacterized protein (TIGR03000 family)
MGSMPFASGPIYDGGMMPGYAPMMSGPMMSGPFMGGPIMGQPSPSIEEQRAPTRPAPSVEERYFGRSPILPDSQNNNRDPNRASVTVKAPNESKIFVDGQPLKLNNGERTFTTPSLPAGQKFEYTFRCEYTRDGERRSRERVVQVKAGGTSTCDFSDDTSLKFPSPPSPIPLGMENTKLASKLIPSADLSKVNSHSKSPMETEPGKFPISAVVSKSPEMKVAQPTTPNVNIEANTSDRTTPAPAKFSVRLPQDALLYVDGRKTNKTGTLREFTTPTLPIGQEFKYELKVELPGPHGYPQSVTTTVSFRAGETVPTLEMDEMLKK